MSAAPEKIKSLEIAQPEHSEMLAGFFKKFPLHGPVEIAIDRGQDFFAPYKIQSDAQITYMLRNDVKSAPHGGEPLGVATFVFYEALMNGQKCRVAMGRDLRIQQTREAVLEWTKHYLPVMDEARRVFQSDYFLSIINMNEVKALNAFLRPRPGRRPMPSYHLYRRFNLVTLHGRFPWAHHPLRTIRIRRASGAIEDALIYYMVKKSKERDFTPLTDANAIRDLIGRWKGLEISDFLVAMDAQENIIGCCAPWSSSGLEEYIPLKYNLIGHNFRQFLKFGDQLGWTRKLTKPVHRLNREASLNFRYMSFLFADNADIFESLLWIAYEEAQPSEFLAYAQMRSDFHLRKPRNWIGARHPYGIYLLVPPGEAMPAVLHPANDRPTYIEPFFI